jgi:hypothetical protein
MGGFEMSRKYDIRNAAWDYFTDLDSHHFHLYHIVINKQMLFESGAKWADKTMIEKACAWLEQHKEDYNKYDAWIGEYVDFNALITDFKKKMKE